MLFKGVVMGFAVIHRRSQKPEYSLNFPELINDMSGMKHPHFVYLGSVNTGEDECQKRQVKTPIETSLPYDKYYMGLNKVYRKRLTKRVYSNTNSLVWPTMLLLFDESRRLVGIIVLPDRSWSSVRDEFYQNLNFFLNPLAFAQEKKRQPQDLLQAPSKNVLEIDFKNWRREWQYELARGIKK